MGTAKPGRARKNGRQADDDDDADDEDDDDEEWFIGYIAIPLFRFNVSCSIRRCPCMHGRVKAFARLLQVARSWNFMWQPLLQARWQFNCYLLKVS